MLINAANFIGSGSGPSTVDPLCVENAHRTRVNACLNRKAMNICDGPYGGVAIGQARLQWIACSSRHSMRP